MNRILFRISLNLLIFSILIGSFYACRGTGKTLVSATGTIYECIAVIDNRPLPSDYHYQIEPLTSNPYQDSVATLYDVVKVVMVADMPCLPQMEPYFNLSQVQPQAFDDFFKSARNILIVDIDSTKYTQTKASRTINFWSQPQAVYKLQAPSDTAFLRYWEEHGTQIREWFVRQELGRQLKFFERYQNHDIIAQIEKSLHIHLCVPNDYLLIMDTTLEKSTQLVWCCNDKGSYRRDLVIYSYPYTDDSTFTRAYLCKKRDEILSQVVSTSIDGSYMATEYKIFPPQIRPLAVQKSGYAMEMRGLWKIQNGEAMGGPFVSHTRIDELRKRVITAEIFVFGAGQKKRNVLRQNEAILYSLQLEQEVNELQEVAVKPIAK